MGYWLDPAQGYCEGDPPSVLAAAVPRRPDATFSWNGNAWVSTLATAAMNAEQNYAALISGGIVITSTSTPALNGIYSIGPGNISDIQAESQFILICSEFTNGTTNAMPWSDASGGLHTFTSTSQFTAFAKAVAQYVSACKLALASASNGSAPVWPTNQATIP